jgi:hypothetical protein
MEHSYIKDHHIADYYLAGRLLAEERIRFEEHFVDCAECHDLLRTAKNFRAGLRIIAAEEAMRFRIYLRGRQDGASARVAWLVRGWRVPLLAVAILLIALPMALLVLEWRSARRDLAQATQTSLEWKRKYLERAAHDPAREMQRQQQELSLQRERLAAQLESTRKTPDSPLRPPRKAAEYEPEAPVFALSVLRGDSPDLSQPVNRIALASPSKWIILLLELEPDPDLHYYRGTISTTDGRSIWTRNCLRPTSRNALALSFKSRLFKPGDYQLTLEGITEQDGNVPVATYPFRVLIR